MIETKRITTERALSETKASSPLEKCSFACHLFLFPVGLAYFLWLTIPGDEAESPTGSYYYPKREYALHLPVTALFIFLAIPFWYAALNTFTGPKLHSIDTIEDVYTKLSSTPQILSRKIPSHQSSLPEICDLDPSTVVWNASHSRHRLSKT
mmetsp:Transcript_653/g.1367  ORF Transcript_653/g.1367 Transcript_653/m.1367 type:complete len:152 (-) Transcript_653:1049-1504(-)